MWLPFLQLFPLFPGQKSPIFFFRCLRSFIQPWWSLFSCQVRTWVCDTVARESWGDTVGASAKSSSYCSKESKRQKCLLFSQWAYLHVTPWAPECEPEDSFPAEDELWGLGYEKGEEEARVLDDVVKKLSESILKLLSLQTLSVNKASGTAWIFFFFLFATQSIENDTRGTSVGLAGLGNRCG